MQSAGYLIIAFLFSSSILITSMEQVFTHIPQPLHSSGSIRSITIMPPENCDIIALKRNSHFAIYYKGSYSPWNLFGYLSS
jgi:hypothetical protein